MKRNQLIIILFFALFFFKSKAQTFELGKVSITELEQKEHPKDPSASAAILFKKGKMSLEYNKRAGFE
jgi:hypothetical protein